MMMPRILLMSDNADDFYDFYDLYSSQKNMMIHDNVHLLELMLSTKIL
jgi:hypothetical protein